MSGVTGDSVTPEPAAARLRLVLWDVDLTLVNLRGVGARWYSRALPAVTGRELREFPGSAGRTELAITREVLRLHGIDDEDGLAPRMFDALATIARTDRDEVSRTGTALAGAAAALRALAEQPRVVQSLVTGNTRELAEVKLGAFGLERHLDFAIGGYGSESEDRRDLVAAAVARAGAKHGVDFPAPSVVVVGDTTHDVLGALHGGATAVGVATGRTTEADLRAAGAHRTLPDLADTSAVLAAVLATGEAALG